jgi:hypothetical protein
MTNELVDLRFPRGYIELVLSDGRRMRVPVRLFPAIKRLNHIQRQQWQILDGVGFTFADSNEGFHLRQFGLTASVDLR